MIRTSELIVAISAAVPWLAAWCLGDAESQAGGFVAATVGSASALWWLLWLRARREFDGRATWYCAVAGATAELAIALAILMQSPREEPFVGHALASVLALLTWLLGALSKVVPRNRAVGFRTRRTLSSSDVWATTNRTWGTRLQVAGLFALIAGASPWSPVLASLVPAVLVGVWFAIIEWRLRTK